MNIRSKFLHGGSAADEPVLLAKQPKGAKPDDLLSVATPRHARRASNHRGRDRHRLLDERVRITWDGSDREVELINLSGGGAMLEGAFEPMLWDRVDLHLGPHGTIECAVCWRRDSRIGLQFVEETRLDCPADEVAAVLRNVIANNFPEPIAELAQAQPEQEPEQGGQPRPQIDEIRAAPRHPLIWKGVLHHNYQNSDVRVRNISATGAMIESSARVRPGTEPLLQLGEIASISTTVEWVTGDQIGLRFHEPFDMNLLAQARPVLSESGWERPAYLQKSGGQDDWDRHWRQLDLDELRTELEGFLKR